jgi:hypothetical protein
VTCLFLTINFCFMSGQRKERSQTNNSSLAAGPSGHTPLNEHQAAEAISHFITFYPPQEAKEALWQLLAGSMSGPHADAWDANERSNIVLFYRLTCGLVDAVHCLHPNTTN